MISRIDFQNLKSGLQIYPFFYQFSICLKQTSKTKSKSLYSVKSVSITRVEPTSKPRLCQHPRPDKSGIKDVQLFHYPFSFSTFPGMILENHPFHRSEQTLNQNWGVQSNRLWFIIFQNLFFFFRWIARQCCQSASPDGFETSAQMDFVTWNRLVEGRGRKPADPGCRRLWTDWTEWSSQDFFCSAGEQKLELDVDGRNRRTLGGLVAG